jgi:hypothetical protein
MNLAFLGYQQDAQNPQNTSSSNYFPGLIFELGPFLCFCTDLCLDTTFGFLMARVSTESTFGKGFLFDLTSKLLFFVSVLSSL